MVAGNSLKKKKVTEEKSESTLWVGNDCSLWMGTKVRDKIKIMFSFKIGTISQ